VLWWADTYWGVRTCVGDGWTRVVVFGHGLGMVGHGLGMVGHRLGMVGHRLGWADMGLGWADMGSVLRSSSVRFFAPKTRNCGLQPVQDRPRYCGDRTGPPRTGLLRSTQPKKTSSDRFFGVNFVVPIKIIFISTIITLKIKRVI
jgi:hypothetical protein